jgi:acyl-CoA thioesterase II
VSETILDVLRLAGNGPDRFVVDAVGDPGEFIFGGRVAAQALFAAASTTPPGHRPHSLHTYFLRAGVLDVPITIEVARLRDGRTFSTRQITMTQNAKPILTMTASFHLPQDSVDWQRVHPEVGDPEAAMSHSVAPIDAKRSHKAMLLRPVDDPGDHPFPRVHPGWARCLGEVGDDPLVHVCGLLFLSDSGLGTVAYDPNAPQPDRFVGASLDHCVWFHREARCDDWLRFDSDSSTITSERSMVQCQVHDRGGRLVMTVMQEILLHLPGATATS